MKTAALLSGGMDSAVAASLRALDLAIWVDYGQQAAALELHHAKHLAKHFGAEFLRVICPLPVDAMNLPPGPGPRVVPGRNAALIGIGLAWASHFGCDTLIWGAALGDRRDYFDCRAEFVDAANRMAEAYGVEIEAPVLGWSREKIRERAATLPPTFSCYSPVGGGKPCGECNSCKQDG